MSWFCRDECFLFWSGWSLKLFISVKWYYFAWSVTSAVSLLWCLFVLVGGLCRYSLMSIDFVLFSISWHHTVVFIELGLVSNLCYESVVMIDFCYDRRSPSRFCNVHWFCVLFSKCWHHTVVFDVLGLVGDLSRESVVMIDFYFGRHSMSLFFKDNFIRLGCGFQS